MNITCLNTTVPWIINDPKQKSDIWNNSASFPAGRKCAVIAPSGRGKTTFIQLLYGLIKNFGGEVTFGDTNLPRMDHYAWARTRREQIAILFQDLRLFEGLSGLENIELKNRLCAYLTREEIMEKAEALGIAGILKRKCGSYSMGEKQRLAFLRALCQPFAWILLDEPFSHVDKANTKIMTGMLLEQVNKNGAGIIAAFLGPEPGIAWDKEYIL